MEDDYNYRAGIEIKGIEGVKISNNYIRNYPHYRKKKMTLIEKIKYVIKFWRNN